MYNTNDDAKYYPFCRLQFILETLDTKVNEPTNQKLIKVPKVVELTNIKTF